MGFFFNSNTQDKRDQILRNIAKINKAIRQVDLIITESKASLPIVRSQVLGVLDQVEGEFADLKNTMDSMSDSQLEGFKVPWIDGVYIGIMHYSFQMNMFISSIDSYINQE